MNHIEAKVAESLASGVISHSYQYEVSGPWGVDGGCGGSDIECLAAAKKAHEDLVKVYGDHREVTARRRLWVSFWDDSEFTGPEEILGSFGNPY